MKTTTKRPLSKRVAVGRFLVIDPGIAHGKLTFKGTRVPVATVLTFLAKGFSIDDILTDWPQLKRQAVEEAIRLAAQSLLKRFVPQRGTA